MCPGNPDHSPSALVTSGAPGSVAPDKAIREADLLQAIARVNRTAAGKAVGYVVDYYGVAHHLAQALEAYAEDDIEGALTSLNDEVPRLAAAHAAVRQLFAGISDFTTVAAPQWRPPSPPSKTAWA